MEFSVIFQEKLNRMSEYLVSNKLPEGQYITFDNLIPEKHTDTREIYRKFIEKRNENVV